MTAVMVSRVERLRRVVALVVVPRSLARSLAVVDPMTMTMECLVVARMPPPPPPPLHLHLL